MGCVASIKELNEIARTLREIVITMIYETKSGHPGGSLSSADLIAALYFGEMNIDPKNPNWQDRDRFILSKGHACPIQYAALGLRGYFEQAALHTLRQKGSILQGHPDMKKCPGIDMSTGSLGQGLSAGVGMALAAKRDAKEYRVFVLIGDGETNEGQIWEAIMTASKYGLDNLIVIMDNNSLQLDGPCDEIMPLLDMNRKMAAFGFETYDINGHDMEQIIRTFCTISESKSGMPKFINARTVKGKGVSYMENQVSWHGTVPNEKQYEQALKEIRRVEC